MENRGPAFFIGHWMIAGSGGDFRFKIGFDPSGFEQSHRTFVDYLYLYHHPLYLTKG